MKGLEGVALAFSGAGVVAAMAGALSTGSLRAGLPIMLDLWMAASLLRNAGDPPGYVGLASAAAIMAVRHLVNWGLRISRDARRS